jgi:hypothetical protein
VSEVSTKEIDQRAIAVAEDVAAVFRVHKHGAAANERLDSTIGFRQLHQQLRHDAGFAASPFDR